ncbi:hypothetical protein K435DRAFT_842741 [Dendrothele bispora CBS 962.96]|uniref:Uncharacterized protein n=1 Tax=Dendrothele bispora (strain CBS 962.96) TaxID=1314807 RepID=A0A4S8LD74_DENBC|nr:hypothetical protein K435DRAFT_842741 [Dendrothele bispora CBS 962.96]
MPGNKNFSAEEMQHAREMLNIQANQQEEEEESMSAEEMEGISSTLPNSETLSTIATADANANATPPSDKPFTSVPTSPNPNTNPPPSSDPSTPELHGQPNPNSVPHPASDGTQASYLHPHSDSGRQPYLHSTQTTPLLDDLPLKARLQPWNHFCIPNLNDPPLDKQNIIYISVKSGRSTSGNSSTSLSQPLSHPSLQTLNLLVINLQVVELDLIVLSIQPLLLASTKTNSHIRATSSHQGTPFQALISGKHEAAWNESEDAEGSSTTVVVVENAPTPNSALELRREGEEEIVSVERTWVVDRVFGVLGRDHPFVIGRVARGFGREPLIAEGLESVVGKINKTTHLIETFSKQSQQIITRDPDQEKQTETGIMPTLFAPHSKIDFNQYLDQRFAQAEQAASQREGQWKRSRWRQTRRVRMGVTIDTTPPVTPAKASTAYLYWKPRKVVRRDERSQRAMNGFSDSEDNVDGNEFGTRRDRNVVRGSERAGNIIVLKCKGARAVKSEKCTSESEDERGKQERESIGEREQGRV